MPNRSIREPSDHVSTAGAALVKVPGAAAGLSKAQREFNRLSGQLQRARARFAEWQAWELRYLERVQNELQPAEAALLAAQRRIVLRFDAMLGDANTLRVLSKRHCATLRKVLTRIARDLLDHAPDPELVALHDKHSELSLEQIREQNRRFAKTVATEVFGIDPGDGDPSMTVDDVFERIDDQVAAQADAKEQARAARAADRAARLGRPSRAEVDAERREQAQKAASASVREVYRKLASSLHPDRESDPAARERKTALMTRANQAYAANDVLALLQLQLEIEQIDAAHLARVPEVQVKHYNLLLREQVFALERGLNTVSTHYADLLGTAFRFSDPQAANAAFSGLLREWKASRRQLESDLRDLDDPRKRRALLDALAREERDFDDALPGDFESFAALFDSPPPPSKGRRRR
jgi:hypothetical protein